jgi:hypothetical protein
MIDCIALHIQGCVTCCLLPSADSCNGGLQNGLGTHGRRQRRADQPELCVHHTDTIVRSSNGASEDFSLAEAVGADGMMR